MKQEFSEFRVSDESVKHELGQFKILSPTFVWLALL